LIDILVFPEDLREILVFDELVITNTIGTYLQVITQTDVKFLIHLEAGVQVLGGIVDDAAGNTLDLI
jgi:hypothetical protein